MVKNHKADSFEAGRAASLIEPLQPPGSPELSMSELSLSGLVKVRAGSEDEDARALALAIMALSADND